MSAQETVIEEQSRASLRGMASSDSLLTARDAAGVWHGMAVTSAGSLSDLRDQRFSRSDCIDAAKPILRGDVSMHEPWSKRMTSAPKKFVSARSSK